MEAPQLDFSNQNKRVLSILKTPGGSINRIEAIDKYRITALNSRISYLRNQMGIAIEGKYEAGSKCLRYSLPTETSQAA